MNFNMKVMHTSWGPEGMKLSFEEKAAIEQKIIQDCEEDFAKTVTIPISQLTAISDALRKLCELGRINLDEFDSIPREVLDLKHEIRGLADMPLLFAEQWLPDDLQKSRRKERLNNENRRTTKTD